MSGRKQLTGNPGRTSSSTARPPSDPLLTHPSANLGPVHSPARRRWSPVTGFLIYGAAIRNPRKPLKT